MEKQKLVFFTLGFRYVAGRKSSSTVETFPGIRKNSGFFWGVFTFLVAESFVNVLQVAGDKISPRIQKHFLLPFHCLLLACLIHQYSIALLYYAKRHLLKSRIKNFLSCTHLEVVRSQVRCCRRRSRYEMPASYGDRSHSTHGGGSSDLNARETPGDRHD